MEDIYPDWKIKTEVLHCFSKLSFFGPTFTKPNVTIILHIILWRQSQMEKLQVKEKLLFIGIRFKYKIFMQKNLWGKSGAKIQWHKALSGAIETHGERKGQTEKSETTFHWTYLTEASHWIWGAESNSPSIFWQELETYIKEVMLLCPYFNKVLPVEF